MESSQTIRFYSEGIDLGYCIAPNAHDGNRNYLIYQIPYYGIFVLSPIGIAQPPPVITILQIYIKEATERLFIEYYT